MTTIETGNTKCLPIPVPCHELGVNIGEAVPQFSLALDLLESSLLIHYLIPDSLSSLMRKPESTLGSSYLAKSSLTL